MRRYGINIIASKGRFFSAGEPIPDDVSVAPSAEKYRIRDEQPIERDSSTTAVDDDEMTKRATESSEQK